MPTLAENILDEALGRIPTVELNLHLPSGRQQRLQCFQDHACQAVLAAKGDAFFRSAFAIETSDRLLSQIESQIDGRNVLADAQGTGQKANTVLVSRMTFATFGVVEVPGDWFDFGGCLVFGP